MDKAKAGITYLNELEHLIKKGFNPVKCVTIIINKSMVLYVY